VQRKEPRMPSQDPDIVISISDCHAVVSRYRSLPNGAISWECACNAEELEADAIAAIAAQRTPFTLGAPYPCPPEVAARAVWPERPTDD
jgi:hypothetical protein